MIFPRPLPQDNYEAAQNLPLTQLLTNSPALPQSENTAQTGGETARGNYFRSAATANIYSRSTARFSLKSFSQACRASTSKKVPAEMIFNS